MFSYPSIETIYTRNTETGRLNFGEHRNQINLNVREWIVTEKIDGMNIRVIVSKDAILVKGRTDKAVLKQDLIGMVLDLFNSRSALAPLQETLREADAKTLAESPNGIYIPKTYTFYGEGYGAGIQTGGCYSMQKLFRCFDILPPNNRWLPESERKELCEKMFLPQVPEIGIISEYAGVEPIATRIPRTRQELYAILPASIVAQQDSDNMNVLPEGIVAKPRWGTLYDTYGNRVMWKLTYREWDEDKRMKAAVRRTSIV